MGVIRLTNWVDNSKSWLATQQDGGCPIAPGRWKGAIAGQLIFEIHRVATEVNMGVEIQHVPL